jgi:hypothetical protein
MTATPDSPIPTNSPAGIVVSDACSVPPKREMSMMAWMATEGGRKCPACGKYAKAEELGSTGGYFNDGQIVVHISSYGHLPGFGCNRSQNAASEARRGETHGQ